MTEQRLMGHQCPTCKKDVYGKLDTKKYCTKNCRWIFHRRKEKQLKVPCEDMDFAQKKNYEVLGFSMGEKKNFFVAPLETLQRKNFRPNEYCSKGFHKGMKVCIVGAYAYYVKNGVVFAFRTREVETFLPGIEARWKMDNPEPFTMLDGKKKLSLDYGNFKTEQRHLKRIFNDFLFWIRQFSGYYNDIPWGICRF